MVAYNFSPRFAMAVKSGMKRQTIRRTLRCAPGDDLQHYTGQRTKDCKLLGLATCKTVKAIRLAPTGITIDGEPMDPSNHDEFARSDGFIDFHEMLGWFCEKYQSKEFRGFLITW